MIYWVIAFMLLMAVGCVPASADKDTAVKDKKVLVKGDDFEAIMQRAKKSQEMAFAVGVKADGAVVKTVAKAAEKISTLETTVKKLEIKNEQLQNQINANPVLDVPYAIEPIVDSTELPKKENN